MDNYIYQKPATDVHGSYCDCTADTQHSTWATRQKRCWTVWSCTGMHGRAWSRTGVAWSCHGKSPVPIVITYMINMLIYQYRFCIRRCLLSRHGRPRNPLYSFPRAPQSCLSYPPINKRSFSFATAQKDSIFSDCVVFGSSIAFMGTITYFVTSGPRGCGGI